MIVEKLLYCAYHKNGDHTSKDCEKLKNYKNQQNNNNQTNFIKEPEFRNDTYTRNS